MDRPLDGMETVFYLTSTVARVNAMAIAQVRGPLTPEALRPALDAAQRRHPLLGVHVERRGQEAPRFVSAGTPPIPLRVAARDGPDHARQEAEAELGASLPLHEGPLLRAVLLQGQDVHDLLLTYNHTIGDALSTAGLVGDLLDAAAEAVAGKAPTLQPLPEQPPMRDLSPLRTRSARGRVSLVREVLQMLGRQLVVRPARLRWDAAAPPAQRSSRLVHRVLGVDQAAALAARCKAEGTTVAGALAAALLLALADDVGTRPATVACSVPANLRPHFRGLPPGAFGYYAWGVGCFLKVTPGLRFWDAARACKAQVDARLADGSTWRSLALLEAAAPTMLRKGPEGLIANLDRNGASAVSNVGRVSAPEGHGPFVWEDLQVTSSADGAGAGMGLVATTFRGRMNLNLVHPLPLIGPARGDAAMARVIARLGAAIDGDPATGARPLQVSP